jgi:hypothetical protein
MHLQSTQSASQTSWSTTRNLGIIQRRQGGGNILLMKSGILADSVSVLGATLEPEVPFIGAIRLEPLFDIAASQLIARDVSMT